MTDDLKPEITTTETQELPPPWRCWLGSLVSGAMAIACYFLTSNIAQAFADRTPTGNLLALKISIAVRTLVVGVVTLGTGMFTIIGIALFLLGFQVLLQTRQNSGDRAES